MLRGLLFFVGITLAARSFPPTHPQNFLPRAHSLDAPPFGLASASVCAGGCVFGAYCGSWVMAGIAALACLPACARMGMPAYGGMGGVRSETMNRRAY